MTRDAGFACLLCMRLLIAACGLMWCACSTAASERDGGTLGVDAGGGDSGPACATATPPCESIFCACVERSELTNCPETRSGAGALFCPVSGFYGVSSETCDEGVKWAVLYDGLGPTATCFYVDAGLVGAKLVADHGGENRTGLVQFSNCAAVADPCGDAGACSPAAPGRCVSLARKWFCEETEAAHRALACGGDAGVWNRLDCADGGRTWVQPRDPFGAHHECAFSEGVLVGLLHTTDAGIPLAAGTWQLAGCVAAPTPCP